MNMTTLKMVEITSILFGAASLVILAMMFWGGIIVYHTLKLTSQAINKHTCDYAVAGLPNKRLKVDTVWIGC